MRRVERGEIELLTSVLSITEVALGAQERDAQLTDDALQAIEELWTPASPITLVDMSEALARQARSIIRDATRTGAGRIGSADAIHLAAARMHGCRDLFTYEQEATRQRWATVTGITVSEPMTDRPPLDL